jgi:hypothetical protein
MPYRHPAARIHEIVQSPKVLAAGQSVEPKKHGSHGLSFEGLEKHEATEKRDDD